MVEPIKHIPTNPKLLRAVWEFHGAAIVVTVLEEVKEHAKMPGMGLALARASAALAELKADMHGHVLREAARAGFDIVTARSVVASIEKGQVVLVITPGDLLGEVEE